MQLTLKLFSILAIAISATVSAHAADPSSKGGFQPREFIATPDWPTEIVSEVRVGGLYHDAGIISNKKEAGADVNAEILFASPEWLTTIWSPRPHLGTSINTSGYTDKVYAGLTWTYDFAESWFTEFSFGPSFDDGHLNKSDHHWKALGSPVLFRESLSLGWRLDRVNSLAIMVDHISNGGLAKYNGGMETIGLRYGYHF